MATLNTRTPAGRPTLTGLRPHWWIGWWYQLAAPVPPKKEQMTVAERDFLRRGKLISIGFLISTIQILGAFESVRENPIPILAPTLIISLFILAFGAMLNRFSTINRRGLSLVASIILMVLTEGSMIGQLLPGPLGLYQWALMTLPVVALMFAVLLFPSWVVFIVAAFNCLAVTVLLLFVPKDATLAHFLNTQPYIIWTLPISLQITSALVSFIVLSSLREHIARADYAEELSRLQQDLAAQKARELEHAQMLEKTVQEISMVLTNVANRQWNARVQLGQSNILPSVTGQINNFIGRYIRLYKQAEPMQRSQHALHNLLLMLRQARLRNVPVSITLSQFPYTGTINDELVQELLFLQTRELSQVRDLTQLQDLGNVPPQRAQSGPLSASNGWKRSNTWANDAQPLERPQGNRHVQN